VSDFSQCPIPACLLSLLLKAISHLLTPRPWPSHILRLSQQTRILRHLHRIPNIPSTSCSSKASPVHHKVNILILLSTALDRPKQ
jgi:hypothetical protein